MLRVSRVRRIGQKMSHQHATDVGVLRQGKKGTGVSSGRQSVRYKRDSKTKARENERISACIQVHPQRRERYRHRYFMGAITKQHSADEFLQILFNDNDNADNTIVRLTSITRSTLSSEASVPIVTPTLAYVTVIMPFDGISIYSLPCTVCDWR